MVVFGEHCLKRGLEKKERNFKEGKKAQERVTIAFIEGESEGKLIVI